MTLKPASHLRSVIGWIVIHLAVGFLLHAETVSIAVKTPPPAQTGYFKLGTTRNPAGQEINLNSRSLLFDGQPVFPVMGEIHYSRVPQAEWREELLKMKAGGIDIVATYVFWIHHEEVRGEWDWSGQRDLRTFI
jgi:beta-galactosidase